MSPVASPRARRLAAVALIATLLIGSCSSGDDDADAVSDSTAPDSATIDTEPAATDPAATDPPATDPAQTEPRTTVTGTTVAGTTIAGTTVDTDGSDGDPSALARGGIVVVVDESASPTAPFTLTEVQAARMLADTSPDGGILGAALDEVAPLPSGAPPMSYLLAAWVSAGTSDSASLARDWMGDQEWRLAPTIRFPLAVVGLFVAEVATLVDTTVPQSGASGFAAAGLQAGDARPLGGQGPCTTVTTFLANTINALFGALRLTAGSGGGVFGDLVSAFATVWNVAVDLARGIVEGLVDTLTAPVMEAIRVGVGALGVATQALSYFQDQKLDVRTVPEAVSTDTYRFAIGTEADIKGEFVATAQSLTASWPPALVDCAQTANAQLPELIAPGGEARWQLLSGAGIVTLANSTTLVQSDRSARVEFVTGREDEETAKGDVTFDPAVVEIQIPRSEVGDFFSFARDQVNGAKSLLLDQIPQADLRAAAEQVYGQAIDPMLDQLQKAAADQAGSVFSLVGSGVVVVRHHTPPTTTTTTPPSTAPPSVEPDVGDGAGNKDAFCAEWARIDPNAEDNDMVTTGILGLERLEVLEPVAPGEVLDELATLRISYEAAAADNFNGVLANAEPFASAILFLFEYCGIPIPEG